MRTVVPLTSEHCPTICTIRLNLLDDDDIAHSAHVSLGTQELFSAVALSLRFSRLAPCQ